EEDEENARQYAAEGWQSTLTAAMPPMPEGDQQTDVDKLVTTEARIREGKKVDIEALRLPQYWADLARLLQIFRHQKDGQDSAIESIEKEMSNRIYDAYISKAAQRSKANPA